MHADAVTLRPVAPEDLWIFERQAVDPQAAGTFNWSGFRDMAALRRRLDEDGLINAETGTLIVMDGATAVGIVSWCRITYGKPSWYCWNTGIILLPEYRGRGLGTRAQAMLVRYLFETTPVERVEAYTDVDNLAEHRALEKAGFTREGVLRRTQFRQGEWRDMAMYSIVRSEFRTMTAR